MATQIGVGVSHNRNPMAAGAEAVAQGLKQANIDQPDFVMLFATVGYRQEMLLKSVRAATAQAPLIGCSVAGTITMGAVDESNFAVTVMVFKSDDMRFVHGLSTGLKDDSFEVGESVGKSLAAVSTKEPDMHTAAKALFLFLEGTAANFKAFMEGLRHHSDLEKSIPAVGGFAADNHAIVQTFQYYNDQIVTDGVAWALLSGEVTVASVVSHGCVPLGEKHTVTKSDRNLVYEVDNLPVLEVLGRHLTKSELDDWGITATMVAWALKASESSSGETLDDEADTFIRAMITKNEQTGAINFLTDIPIGSEFWFARRDPETILANSNKMTDELVEQLQAKTPKLIFHVECVGRGKLIFREQEKLKLLNNRQARIGTDIPWLGLYSFGEIGPIADHNQLHNFTSILTALY